VERLRPVVYEHKIVSSPVHLGEFQKHRRKVASLTSRVEARVIRDVRGGAS
jgi:hypothetical protein